MKACSKLIVFSLCFFAFAFPKPALAQTNKNDINYGQTLLPALKTDEDGNQRLFYMSVNYPYIKNELKDDFVLISYKNTNKGKLLDTKLTKTAEISKSLRGIAPTLLIDLFAISIGKDRISLAVRDRDNKILNGFQYSGYKISKGNPEHLEKLNSINFRHHTAYLSEKLFAQVGSAAKIFDEVNEELKDVVENRPVENRLRLTLKIKAKSHAEARVISDLLPLHDFLEISKISLDADVVTAVGYTIFDKDNLERSSNGICQLAEQKGAICFKWNAYKQLINSRTAL